MKLRILFVLANFHPYIGGAEKLFLRLTEGLVRKGHSVRVITTHLPGTPYFETINGVEVERVRVPGFARQYLFSILGFTPVIRKARSYDIIHTSSNYGALVAFLVAKITRQPTVFTCHEVLGQRWLIVERSRIKAFFLRNIENLVISFTYDRYIAVSQATLRDLVTKGINSEKVTVIYNGVDETFSAHEVQPSGKLRALCGINHDAFLYGYFGRPGATKGVEYLVKAAKLIESRIPGARLALILAREPRDNYNRIDRFIQDNKLDNLVKEIPPFISQEELIQHLIDLDCVVIPSLTEGFGLTTAEACALGLPVVATRVGSIPEVISGRHILIEPFSPEAIAAGVIQVWQGHYEWTFPKRFEWARMVDQYESVYRELL